MTADATQLVSAYLQLLRRSPVTPDGAVSVLSTTLPLRDDRPCALILSPHPDDECLVGALPLRFAREANWQIINVAVTLGSNAARRASRATELARACAVVGFDAVLSDDEGFSCVTVETRESDSPAWHKMIARLRVILEHCQPRAIFLPHAYDAHPSHIGTHYLGMDTLAKLSNLFTCAIFETEYWQPHAEPNMMVGIDAKDAAILLSALSCHSGENARNAFDARFPAYLIDNVRRGSERVGGAGKSGAPMDFAMLYRYGVWKNGKFIPSALRRLVAPDQKISILFD